MRAGGRPNAGGLPLPITEPSEDAAPPFCPACRRAPDGDHRGLCERCGASLAAQGYCPTCEGYWPLAVGEPCPKHDQPLGPAPPPAEARAGLRWATLRIYDHPVRAELARLRLDAEGIPTQLVGERFGAMYPSHAALGVRLQVPAELVQEARVLLAQSWAVPPDDDAIDGEDEPDDLAATGPEDWPEPVEEAAAPPSWALPAALLAVAVLGVAALVALIRTGWAGA